ncbi:cytochrome b [Thalassoroseus pseudoceratinae]|uniref:cytochrome b n=1 Tax=Thalassoroseus pseudoceratinae TaxID=2713176 RepID=UPI001422CCD9|nr:cytochrome bc complex cytochrome b subunit [Thalassoroseus pseudoceratinae]
MTSKNLLGRLADWLDHRVGTRHLVHEALYERIPGGSRWRYVWGSTLVYTFTVQFITGIFLWTAYSPSASTAWESVYYINNVMYLGHLVRGIHHFAAQAMVVLMALHLMQIIIDGAYKAPREINFWLGLVLMLLVFGFSLTGYLLPWDQKGYYATQVSTKIAGATPVIGNEVQTVIQGGPKYGHQTLTRFFALHVGVLPVLLIAFLGLHLYVFRRHGITPADPDHAPTTTFWPDQVLKDAVACLAVLATVVFFAVYFGAELSAPANPSEPYSAARPEWYYLFLFRFLRYEWVEHLGLAFGAIYFPGFLFTILIAMPLIAHIKGGHMFNKIYMWLVVVGIVFLTGLAMYEDKNDIEHQLALQDAHIDGERVQELAALPRKIPVEGAVSLLANDPFTQGPKIFAKQCAACHRWNGHDGRRRFVLSTVADGDDVKQILTPPTAADLGDFGTREWTTNILLNYDEVFAPLKNAGWYQQAKADDDLGSVPGPGESEMSDYLAENHEYLSSNEKDVQAIVEYFAKISERKDLEPIDEKLAARGEAIVTGDADGLSYSCFDCHHQTLDEADSYGYPSLHKYGSVEWLKDFITNPGSGNHYGDSNQMPAYTPDRLSPHDLDMLTRWMVGDYDETEIELPPVMTPAGVEIEESTEKNTEDGE